MVCIIQFSEDEGKILYSKYDLPSYGLIQISPISYNCIAAAIFSHIAAAYLFSHGGGYVQNEFVFPLPCHEPFYFMFGLQI